MSDEERRLRRPLLLSRMVIIGDGLGKLARHETTLMNAFTKTLQMLLLLQENRGTKPVILEAVSLPAAA